MPVHITGNFLQEEEHSDSQRSGEDDTFLAAFTTTPLPELSHNNGELTTLPAHHPYYSDENVIIKKWLYLFGQILRFCMVGGLNTALDLLLFNVIFWLWPTQNSLQLLVYNSIAYALGGINSFLLNKYWTFGHRQRIARSEIISFTITTLLGIGANDAILWLCSRLIHLQHINPTLWANSSKLIALFCTCLISYVGMRMWVFARKADKKR
ncbi:GtrA family protein [Dictyobacter kobayashii]|nr:GtrA family protein [Dictyobacter kobayashii]